jgi:hypothetical protein
VCPWRRDGGGCAVGGIAEVRRRGGGFVSDGWWWWCTVLYSWWVCGCTVAGPKSWVAVGMDKRKFINQPVYVYGDPYRRFERTVRLVLQDSALLGALL